ncbi:MAG: sigma-54-dependent Fis family transcriptional regulator [Deltaproteobacteria bacterium]|nr:sigma-54-dependent Fis family transcriptional regulator [Deltaproteobacteria bacterium]
MAGTILVAEDQEAARKSLCELLRQEGYQVYEAADGPAAIKLATELDFDLILTDLRLPGEDGLAVLKHIREISPQTLSILMTAYASVDTAIEALRLGAQDYMLKPLIFEDVLRKIRHLMEHKRLAWEIQILRREINDQFFHDYPVGRSHIMQEIMTLIEKVAPTPATVLITGESGVGKEVVARTIHLFSPRKDNVFLAVNCSAIPETLLESQLFGYVKGAFTGATASQEGLFQRAREGTIFLDEIGEMPLSLQPKLLRVIEEKKVLPVGSTNPVQVDVRILASTNRDLKEEVDAARFRGDLYYRLNVIGVQIPPLRMRREDIPLLVEHLIHRHNLEMKKSYKGVDNMTMRTLMSLPWKGNIRELDNVLERAMILGSGEWITVADLPYGTAPARAVSEEDNLNSALEDYEKSHIERTLEKSAGDKKRAAELLGMSISTLYRKIERLGIGENGVWTRRDKRGGATSKSPPQPPNPE